jgi:hypothetical protein
MEPKLDEEKHSFILAWSAVIWEKIWSCAYTYSEYRNVSINNNVLLKCLKYNLLSPTGILKDMLPSLKLALTQGFLMPKEYENNKYVKKAVSLFGEAYRISKDPNRKVKEKEFIQNLSSKLETEKNQKELCDLIDIWDIEIGLCEFNDPYEMILMYALLSVFEIDG